MSSVFICVESVGKTPERHRHFFSLIVLFVRVCVSKYHHVKYRFTFQISARKHSSSAEKQTCIGLSNKKARARDIPMCACACFVMILYGGVYNGLKIELSRWLKTEKSHHGDS